MKESRVAIRYAKSLLTLSIELGELEKAHEDMQLVAETCKNSKDLILLLKNPIIKTDKKIVVLREIFGKRLREPALLFIEIIARKKRESFLEYIAKSFIKQYKSHKNILTATVTTAVGLDEQMRKNILDIVKAGKASEVDLIEAIDERLIGGYVLQVEDNQSDNSIRNKLNKLSKDFKKNPYQKEF